jgi:hypothetical protein
MHDTLFKTVLLVTGLGVTDHVPADKVSTRGRGKDAPLPMLSPTATQSVSSEHDTPLRTLKEPLLGLEVTVQLPPDRVSISV